MTDNPGVPNVIRVLRAFEAALEQNDMSAADEMGRQWLAIEARLEPQVAALANEITQLRTSGQVVTEAMLLKQARYQSLLKQIDLEIKVFNRTSGVPIISNGQAIDAELGLKAAQEAIRAAYFDSGQVGGAFDVLHVDAVQKMVGFASDGSPLHSLLAKDYADAVDGVTKALIGGVARGLGPLAVAREMRDGMGMGLDRALLIARTEMLRSYRQASLDQYKAAGVVTKYMRRCANDERSCVECLAEDGMIMDTDALFDSHPDCRCFVIPILEGEPLPEMQTGEEWLAAQPEAYQKEILGPGRFELYQNGMPLIDMVDVVQDPDWGPTLELKTLGELREIGANMEKAADNAYDVIRFGQGGTQNLGMFGDFRNLYPDSMPGKDYLTPMDVILNEKQSQYIYDGHEKNIAWMEEHNSDLLRALQSPDYIEQQIENKKRGVYGVTVVVDIADGKYPYLSAHIRLAKIGNNVHKLWTTYPAGEEYMLENGVLKARWRKLK